MKKSFRARFGADVFTQVDFNTVDGFQVNDFMMFNASFAEGAVVRVKKRTSSFSHAFVVVLQKTPVSVSWTTQTE